MLTLLSKIFIKNSEDVKNPVVREKYGVLCGVTGILLNVFLFAGKLIAGLLSKSVSIVADALNNLSDAAASIVTIVGFKLSGKQADEDHPFGHGRMEYIAGLIVSFLILLVGFELFKSSINSIIHPEPVDSSVFTIVALSASILVKFYMYFYNHKIGKKIESTAMEATAKDSLNDTISTFVVLLSVVLILFFPELKIPFDGIAGIFVAVFILVNGIEALKDTINPLLGTSCKKEFTEEIEKLVMSFEPICGMHDLIVHDYGPGRVIISLHAEVPGDKDIFELHDVIDNAEAAVSKKFSCVVTIHMDPVDVGNEEVAILKKLVSEKAVDIVPGLTIHDLRMVPGETHTNVIFDAVRPYSCNISDEELKIMLSKIVSDYNPMYNCVIQIDVPFV